MGNGVTVKSKYELAYEAFLNGTEPVTDSIRKGARAYMLLSIAIGKVLTAQTAIVGKTADDMTRDRDYMSSLNDVITRAGTNPPEDRRLDIFSFDSMDDYLEFRAAFLLAAKMDADPNAYNTYDDKRGDGRVYWRELIPFCNTALKNLQYDVDDLNSLSQEQQMALHTLMNNLDNCIEAATSGIKDAGGQAQSAVHSLST